MLVDGVCIEKEGRTDKRFVEEVTSKVCYPLEYRESSAGLQHEQRNDLLKEKPDDDSGPKRN